MVMESSLIHGVYPVTALESCMWLTVATIVSKSSQRGDIFDAKCEGNLKGPVDIAIDTSGLIYVSEDANHRISVFTSEGQFISTFGREGYGPGKFNSLLT